MHLGWHVPHTAWKLLDEVYPPSCVGCQKFHERWCAECQSTVRVLKESQVCYRCGIPQDNPSTCQECLDDPPAFEVCRSWAHYEGTLRLALIRLKYHRDLGLAELLGAKLSNFLQAQGWTPEVIIPVPLGVKRMRERGYNQSAMIARWVSRQASIPIDEHSLRRVKETISQVGLDRESRIRNLHEAFSCLGNAVRDKNVLLIDDVITTGATIRSCSLALQDAGVGKIQVLSAARAGNFDLN